MIGNHFRGLGTVIIEVDKNKKCRYNKVKENDNNSIECGNNKVFDDLLIFWFPKYKIESKTVDYSQSPSTNWVRILPIGR